MKCEAKRRLDRRIGGSVETLGAGVHDGVGGDAAVGGGGGGVDGLDDHLVKDVLDVDHGCIGWGVVVADEDVVLRDVVRGVVVDL